MSKNFDKFNRVLDEYMPAQGEGNSVASQIATVVAKMAYRWFNDGDTVNSDWDVEGASMPGGVSYCANWLFVNVDEARSLLRDWLYKFDHEFISGSMYEDFLYDVCTNLLDPDLLDGYVDEPKRDSIYAGKWHDGKFKPESYDDEF